MYIKKGFFIILLVVALILGGVGVLFAQRLGVSNSSLLTDDEYEDYQYLVNTYGKLDDIKRFVEDYYYVDVDEAALIEMKWISPATASSTVPLRTSFWIHPFKWIIEP